MPHPLRVRRLNDAPLREGEYVLYWMVANRRSAHNHALDRALWHCREQRAPLLVLEALRAGYRWASDRLHRFCIDGMADNARAFEDAGVTYYPYVEEEPDAGKGLLRALAARAAVVVTDDFPSFFLPRMLAAAADQLEADGAALEAVDGNGLYPMADAERTFTRAHSFRRHLQKRLPMFLGDLPEPAPLQAYDLPRAAIPESVPQRWPPAPSALLQGEATLDAFPIDHSVRATEPGGRAAGLRCLESFFASRYPRYGEGRNHPDDDVASGLSPFLHWGHVSAHEVARRVFEIEEWTPERLAPKPHGSREGWWGMSPSAESFLDELITWRELGYNAAAFSDDFDRFDGVPDWARTTLAEHEADERPHLYDAEALDAAATHDPIWNAAQRQLVETGRMHNYLRMLWGKKVLEWSESPRQAFDLLVHLNNRYALDGRNPNSYSGIGWVFGRFDRAWGPERPIFGKVRFMSSESTRKKLRLGRYLEAHGPQTTLALQ